MDEFGDRMKLYEHQEAGRRLLPLLPVCARVDGKGFSKFTKGLQRPYDTRLVELMCQTTAYLVQEAQACISTRMRHSIRKRVMRCKTCCDSKASIGMSTQISSNAVHLFKNAL